MAKNKTFPARFATPPNPASLSLPIARTCGPRTASKYAIAFFWSPPGADSIAAARYCAVSSAALQPCPRLGHIECAASPINATVPSLAARLDIVVVTPPGLARALANRSSSSSGGRVGDTAPVMASTSRPNASGNVSAKNRAASSAVEILSNVQTSDPAFAAWTPPGRITVAVRLPFGHGGASNDIRPLGHVWKHFRHVAATFTVPSCG